MTKVNLKGSMVAIKLSTESIDANKLNPNLKMYFKRSRTARSLLSGKVLKY